MEVMASDRDPEGRRKRLSSHAPTKTPSVERSLDAFIARANEDIANVDVSYFSPEKRDAELRRVIDELSRKLNDLETTTGDREALLRRQVDDLKSRLAAAEAHATPAAPHTRWGAVAIAFVVGGALVFAVSALVPATHDTSAQEARVQPAEPPAKPAMTVTPIESPPPSPPPPVAQPVPVQPVAAVQPAPAPPRITRRPPPVVAKPTPPVPTPPPAKKSDPGLTNPF